jgi:dolichyl-phosphate-mannose-protein mannosyltransferase
MSSTSSNLRQRTGKKEEKYKPIPAGEDDHVTLDKALRQAQQNAPKDWDYKVALTVITALAFFTRFYLINHPDEVVFDEVHFGKVYLFP